MWNKRLCLGTSSQFGLPVDEQILLFKQIGFDGFFTNWQYGQPVDRWAELARENGMIYQSMHAPFGKMAAMWQPGEEGDAALEELLECLSDCARCGVPVMICHAFIGFEDHSPTQTGIDRFRVLVDRAQECGVRIAFENTEGEEYLFALMDAFRDHPAAGFCLDTGHEMCYNHSQNLLARFGDRLIATHLNDNLGIRDFDGKITWLDDLHLLPFDGIADWDNIGARIAATGFDGPLTFELNTKSKPDRHENDVYDRIPIEDYLVEAYKRACRVAAKCR